LLAELHFGHDDQARLAQLKHLARATEVPLVAAGDVHYHIPARMVLHDVLTAIRHGTTVSAAEGTLLFPNAQRHLRPVDEIRALFAAAPDAVARTIEIADRCRFSLDELRYEYPTELAPPGKSPLEYLTQLTWQGADERYPAGVPEKVRQQLKYELELIRDLRYESYFLTVWDLVRFARSKNILCQGRGSAANSAVCFCLGVTSVDPATSDLLFERFVSRERNEAPDIDVDFEHERREEVLQYVYEKYGRDRAGLAATVITYCSRSAIRDVGKALGLSLDRVDALAKHVEGYKHEPKLAGRAREVGIDPASELGRRLVYCVNEIIGFPRHLSQHVGGMVMTQGPLCEMVPIENAAMEGRTVIEWDKDDLDELGILKVDCLCLGMLTAIHKCFDLVREHYKKGVRNLFSEHPGSSAQKVPDTFFVMASIPPDDQAVYDMICRADTIGVFQIESRAQMSMLPRLKPRRFYDLVIEVAIVRPGPIQGNMVHPYLRRRAGEEEETYPNEAIREVLSKTLGVPIFQEQAMRLAVVAAGFTPGEADQLRRAMAAWRRPGLIDQFRKKLLDGMRANNLPEDFAQRVYRQIEGFGEYGFPESHAASFALLVYASAWLKHYYPAAFAAAMINSQPMGFYAPAQLVRDARDHGVAVRPVDVNYSRWDCTLEEGRDSRVESRELEDCGVKEPNPQSAIHNPQFLFLRLGLRMLNGLRKDAGEAIERARRAGPFVSIDDFARRTGLGQAVIKRLAEADAFGSLGTGRRQSLWHALGQEKKRRDMPLFTPTVSKDRSPQRQQVTKPLLGRRDDRTSNELPAALPPMQLYEEVVADYRTAGLSLRAHPISFYRQQLERLGITPARRLVQLPNDAPVTVAGLVLLRQRPGTAKGITFVTLEDETGTVNLVVHQHTWDRYYRIARRAPAWIAHGHIQTTRENSFAAVIHVVVSRLEALAEQLRQLDVKSRDFR
jgi:error-prone DNA polymerase